MSNNIKVICRFRPQNSNELKHGGVPVIEIDDNNETVKVVGSSEFKGAFTFDRIFGSATSQEEFFNYSVRSTVEDVFNGYNGTVFAYGQTGSGKTFTMMGAETEDGTLRGVIPRMVETIFTSIHESPNTIEYTVKVSYMEIYMERIRDLLNPENDNLPIHEERSRGVYVKGLRDVYVSSIPEVYEVMKQGSSARIVAYTNMNAESSRSHSIFVINITQKNLNDGKAKVGRLYLVDLAGSEKVGKTGASGQVLEEAKKINKSLSALGMVINTLTDGKSIHVPYRDSKLTRILQESLGGNSRTTLIINCSPSSYNDAETISTLRFGMRAKSIKNKAKVNQDLSPAELKALLKSAKAQEISFKSYIGALEGEVKIWRMGGTVPPEQYATLERARAIGGRPAPAALPAPSIGSIISDVLRPMTPAVALADDEREEFLKRENELTDQLAEKETEIIDLTKVTQEMTDEIQYLREESTALSIENKEVGQDLQHIKIQLDRTNHANKEANITIEGYKLSNAEIARELAEAKQKVTEMSLQQLDTGAVNKQKLKEEKMAKMMSEIDPSFVLNKDEQELQAAFQNLNIDSNTTGRPTIVALTQRLNEKVKELTKFQTDNEDLRRDNEQLNQKYTDMLAKLNTLELEYEELLDRTIAEEEEHGDIDITETIQELKNRLEAQYGSKRDQLIDELNETKADRDVKAHENSNLRASVLELKEIGAELKNQIDELRTSTAEAAASESVSSSTDPASLAQRERDIEILKKSMMNKLKEFDVMRKAMMRDLQMRCEKIIELEVALDEARDENNMLRRKNVHSVQQQKTAILEKNIAQLMSIQKELVDQNTNLKKESAMAERKLGARNERIDSLEALLLDTQEKMASQRQKYETQLQILKEKLGQSRNVKATTTSTMSGILNFGRIAKPLRGGGGSANGSPNVANGSGEVNGTNGSSALSTITESPATPNKRTSWLGWSR
ncbi:kinesin heavy chain [Dimargaris cristalligena]|uniref:Kinesin-like protein n=1 Tax=Dimargaris cristalligena TaxID=215637 RepID=A0A4V1J5G0_9FUNG|nr:kinesin heavy chain [Dimargaris cristalligena]|eukprot:RKP38929.1 kinesin heavy chain [Dimargaris cristalligena]